MTIKDLNPLKDVNVKRQLWESIPDIAGAIVGLLVVLLLKPKFSLPAVKIGGEEYDWDSHFRSKKNGKR